jgi:hypothetical protein
LKPLNVDVASHSTDIAIVLLGGIAATAIAGMVGVGVGALVTNQTFAVTDPAGPGVARALAVAVLEHATIGSGSADGAACYRLPPRTLSVAAAQSPTIPPNGAASTV